MDSGKTGFMNEMNTKIWVELATYPELGRRLKSDKCLEKLGQFPLADGILKWPKIFNHPLSFPKFF